MGSNQKQDCGDVIMRENSSDPDVLLLIDGEVGVQVDHLWRPVGRRGVPSDLQADTQDMSSEHRGVSMVAWRGMQGIENVEHA